MHLTSPRQPHRIVVGTAAVAIASAVAFTATGIAMADSRWTVATDVRVDGRTGDWTAGSPGPSATAPRADPTPRPAPRDSADPGGATTSGVSPSTTAAPLPTAPQPTAPQPTAPQPTAPQPTASMTTGDPALNDPVPGSAPDPSSGASSDPSPGDGAPPVGSSTTDPAPSSSPAP